MGEESPFPRLETIRVRTAAPDTAAGAALAARLGPGGFARALARPRAREGFLLLAEGERGSCGHGLIGHERRALGAASLDVAALALSAATAAAIEPLLAAAVAAAAAAGLPFLVLRGDPADFAVFGLAPCALVTRVLLPVSTQVAAALRAAAPDDAEDLAALADAAAAPMRLAQRRAAPDWRWLLDAPEGWLVLEDGRGRTVAYAALEGAAVVEAAAADAGAARSLVVALGAHGAASLALPTAHDVARAALQLGGVATIERPHAGTSAELWGVIELAAALEAVAGELGRRLSRSRYAGWEGVVRLEGAAGAASLRCAGGEVTVEERPGAVDVLVGALGLAAAAQLLLGYRPAADLRATGELRCADVDLGLLDSLFPAL